MKKFWRVTGILLVLLVAILLLVYFTAGQWLETSAGRNLLQRELGKGLGVDAELNGEYSLQMFPGFQIAGQDMKLRNAASGQAIASLAGYRLHLALWPLIRKRIVINRLAVSDGFFDLDLFSSRQEGPATEAAPPAKLPTIRSLEISQLRLLKSRADLLVIDHAELEGFAEGADAGFLLGISLPDGETGSSLVEFQGAMRLDLAPMRLALEADTVTLRVNGTTWPLGSGRAHWSGITGTLEGSLEGQVMSFISKLEFVVHTQPGLAINLAANLGLPDQRMLAASLSAHDETGSWRLEPVELRLDDQEFSGQGCLVLEDKPTLHLQLQSPALDIDKLQTLLPEGMTAPQADTTPGSGDLPLEIAVEIRADQATLSGAEARDVRLQLGGQPNCASGEPAS